MLTFYRRLYPFKSVYGWLNHDHMPTRLWTHREFAFTLAGDVYVRYKSYNNSEELKADVCKLNPSRFEIGPVYSARVSLITLAQVVQKAQVVALQAQRQENCPANDAHAARARFRY